LTASQLAASISTQRCSKQMSFLTSTSIPPDKDILINQCNKALPYPHVALLIAAAHTQTSGHDTFNFEILYDKFISQVRISGSAPIQSEKGGLGMVNVARGVMFKVSALSFAERQNPGRLNSCIGIRGSGSSSAI
jgi:origin recognition complex subunit 4